MVLTSIHPTIYFTILNNIFCLQQVQTLHNGIFRHRVFRKPTIRLRLTKFSFQQVWACINFSFLLTFCNLTILLSLNQQLLLDLFLTFLYKFFFFKILLVRFHRYMVHRLLFPLFIRILMKLLSLLGFPNGSLKAFLLLLIFFFLKVA